MVEKYYLITAMSVYENKIEYINTVMKCNDVFFSSKELDKMINTKQALSKKQPYIDKKWSIMFMYDLTKEESEYYINN